MRSIKRSNTIVLASLLSASFLISSVSGCGKKGPLYMPEDKPQTEQTEPTKQPSQTESTTK